MSRCFYWQRLQVVDVAQLAVAPGCGPGGRGFEPHHSPHHGAADSGCSVFTFQTGVFCDMNMRLPAYPLITIDPFCSIWSPGDELNRVDTVLWNDIDKRLLGYVSVDGVSRRFLGKGHASDEYVWQTGLDVTPLITTYTLESDQIRLKVRFWSPLFLDDLTRLSLPVGFIDYDVESTDGQEHDIEIHFSIHEDFAGEKPSIKRYESHGHYGVLYNGKQKSLGYSGDCVDADWGYYYLYGEEVHEKDDSYYRLESVHRGRGQRFTAGDMLLFDDVVSVEYMGRALRGFWTETYRDIHEAASYCASNHKQLYEKAVFWNEKLLADAADFGEDYQKVISAAYRQVLAAHKLVRDTDGKILYFSKECLSNGCMNTVDVSFPAIPLFLLYAPELLTGMMNAIFEFSKLPVWRFPFAPHDIGCYPWGGGQVYGCRTADPLEQRRFYLGSASDDVYNLSEQMPVENSGNLIIMCCAYYQLTGNLDYLRKYYSTLKEWADDLIERGDCRDLQLCTDDFAGKFEGNINLAIKAAIAIAAFGRLAALFGESGERYHQDALQKARYIETAGRDGDHLAAAFTIKPSWSLKYNLIWDRLLQLGLFSDTLYNEETALYLREEKPYGVPLNSMRSFTKSDWLMWVSALDQTGAMTGQFASTMVKMLTDMKCRVPFTDFYNTVNGEWLHLMCHRTTQGGLWMPVLAKRMADMLSFDRL